MDLTQFDMLGRYGVSSLREQAGCPERDCAIELLHFKDGTSTLKHQPQAYGQHPYNRYHGVTVLYELGDRFTAEDSRAIIRMWRGEHAEVDLRAPYFPNWRLLPEGVGGYP